MSKPQLKGNVKGLPQVAEPVQITKFATGRSAMHERCGPLFAQAEISGEGEGPVCPCHRLLQTPSHQFVKCHLDIGAGQLTTSRFCLQQGQSLR
jgi:hypothetical protein